MNGVSLTGLELANAEVVKCSFYVLLAGLVIYAIVEGARTRAGVLGTARKVIAAVLIWLIIALVASLMGLYATGASELLVYMVFCVVAIATISSVESSVGRGGEKLESALGSLPSGLFAGALLGLVIAYAMDAILEQVSLPNWLVESLLALLASAIVLSIALYMLPGKPSSWFELGSFKHYVVLRDFEIPAGRLSIRIPRGTIIAVSPGDQARVYAVHPDISWSVTFRYGTIMGEASELALIIASKDVRELIPLEVLDEAAEEDFEAIGLTPNEIEDKIVTLLSGKKKTFSRVKLPFIEIVEGPDYDYVRVGPMVIIDSSAGSSVRIGSIKFEDVEGIVAKLRDYSRGVVKVISDNRLIYKDSSKKIIESGKRFVAKTRKRKVVIDKNIMTLKSEGVKVSVAGNVLKVFYNGTKIVALREPPVIRIYREGELVEKRMDPEAVKRAFERAENLVLRAAKSIVREEPVEKLRFEL